MIFMRSSGETTVRDTHPAMPPATKFVKKGEWRKVCNELPAATAYDAAAAVVVAAAVLLGLLCDVDVVVAVDAPAPATLADLAPVWLATDAMLELACCP